MQPELLKPEIRMLPEKKLVGKRISMSLANNKTGELWRSFMPRRKEIKNGIGTDLYSVQVFDSSLDFRDFNMDTVHEKWAAVEVANFDSVPQEMEAFVLPAGLYAVFNYKGPASGFAETFHYIFEKWLPVSGYQLDKRPHFEILGEKYKNEDPDSEEEIWIPVKEE